MGSLELHHYQGHKVQGYLPVIERKAPEAMQSRPLLNVTTVDLGLVLVLGIEPTILDCCGTVMTHGLEDHH